MTTTGEPCREADQGSERSCWVDSPPQRSRNGPAKERETLGNVAKRRALKSAGQKPYSGVSAGRRIGRFRPYKAEVGGSKPPAPTKSLPRSAPIYRVWGDHLIESQFREIPHRFRGSSVEPRPDGLSPRESSRLKGK
jgi:hypothetical protein